ncbi:MAG: PEP-CTERM sorting domain-containing protein [Planctomycetota bacterium]|nr:MAG: PEP-CTERM sorting domain-containing protein [Planctomycetota bacterium]
MAHPVALRACAHSLLLLAGFVTSAVLAQASLASEIVVRSFEGPPNSPFVPFEADMRMATRMTSPVDGTIVGVQLLWGSGFGTAAPAQQTAIRISDTVPLSGGPSILLPGAVLATIDAPVLIDGGANEFRFLDPGTNLIPLSVPVSAGQHFFVDLESPEPPDAPFPGLLRGNSPGLQNFMAIPSARPGPSLDGWWDTIAVHGPPAYAMRAIIEPVPEPSSVALLGVGLAALTAVAYRRRRNAAVDEEGRAGIAMRRH